MKSVQKKKVVDNIPVEKEDGMVDDTPKVEAAKVEALKVEAPKIGASKVEAPKKTPNKPRGKKKDASDATSPESDGQGSGRPKRGATIGVTYENGGEGRRQA